jgi:DNA-binding transcriptional MerR regulator
VRKTFPVRISELSAQTGVPVATVKYYLREGLLPPGERTAANQARYGQQHVERLRLIRAMVEVGGVSIAGVKDVLAALDGPVHHLLGAVQDAITPRPQQTGHPDWEEARAEVGAFVRDLGWQVRRDAPALDQLADLLLATRAVSDSAITARECFGGQARFATELAAVEVPTVAGGTPEEVARAAVLGMVLGGRAFEALRRLAQQDASARVFGDPGGDPGDPGAATREMNATPTSTRASGTSSVSSVGHRGPPATHADAPAPS